MSGKKSDWATPETSVKDAERALNAAELIKLPNRPKTKTRSSGTRKETRGSQNWTQKLIYTQKGQIKKCLRNYKIALTEAPAWRGVLAFNERISMPVYRRRAPTGEDAGPIADASITHVRIWLERELGFAPGADDARSVLFMVAKQNRFDPVRDYLDGISWDGKPRLDQAAAVYLGAEDTRFASAALAKWMISAVARARRPGCKADHMLVFEGEQGIGKSSFFRVLAGEEYFSDTLPPLNANGGKEAKQHIHSGPWIVEWSELAEMHRSKAEAQKSFTSAQVDRYRSPYGRVEESHPRRVVFSGTTNSEEWSQDSSGARRFWPIAVMRVDLKAVQRDRDQLWAEADHRYQAGEDWWFDEALEAEARAQQSQRHDSDPWEQLLADFLWGRQTPVTTIECLDHIGRSMSDDVDRVTSENRLRWTTGHKRRVAQCLRRLEPAWRRNPNSRPTTYGPPEGA
jgi:predicted P-loop ATPase